MYFVFGHGLIAADTESRYFPQAEKLSESLANFFQQTGPAYSLFLLFFKKLTNNMVWGPVLFQHILGIISALLVFFYFKRVNLILAFFVAVLVYSGSIAMWLEHTVLRESLGAFFLVLLVVLTHWAVRRKKYLSFIFGFPAGLAGIILFFLKIEFLPLFLLMPLILLFLKKGEDFNPLERGGSFFRWLAGYLCPLLIVFVLYAAALGAPRIGTTYDSFFNIAYHSLIPDVFYYNNSKYPELLKSYQKALEDNQETAGNSHGKVSQLMKYFYQATQDYLALHPETKLSMLQLMDRLYVDMMINNPAVYLKSSLINFKNHLLGIAELNTMALKGRITTQIPILDTALRFYNISLIWFHLALFWLFLPSLLFLFVGWKRLPQEVLMAFLVSFAHIFILTFIADPAHRFRYAVDPFLYFFQLYLIAIFLKTLLSRCPALIFKK